MCDTCVVLKCGDAGKGNFYMPLSLFFSFLNVLMARLPNAQRYGCLILPRRGYLFHISYFKVNGRSNIDLGSSKVVKISEAFVYSRLLTFSVRS